mgnify:CR=1 FL=1
MNLVYNEILDYFDTSDPDLDTLADYFVNQFDCDF